MQPLISSLQNPKLKQLIKLRDAKYRRQQRAILIDGLREIRQAVAGGVELKEIWFQEGLWSAEEFIADLQHQLPSSIIVQPVTSAVFDRLQFGDRHEGVVAVAKTPNLELGSLELGIQPLVVVIDGVEKPGNIGAICRTAAAANVTALILSDCRCEPFNPNAIRSSLGHIFRIPLATASAEETIGFLNRHGIKMHVARVQAAKSHFEADFRSGSAIVLGSEAHGLEGAWLDAKTLGIRIPMANNVDSLNVSVSAAILLYEAVRQRET